MAQAADQLLAAESMLTIKSIGGREGPAPELRVRASGAGGFTLWWNQHNRERSKDYPDAASAAGFIADWLKLAPGSRASKSSLTLSVSASAALLAAAEAISQRTIRARALGRPERKPVLTAHLLSRMLKNGASERDAHPILSLMRDERFKGVADEMTSGLVALEKAGLIEPIPRGSALSDAGERLVSSLVDFYQAVAIARPNDGPRASLFCGRDAMWLVTWSTNGTAWRQTDRSGVEREIASLLTMPAAPTSKRPKPSSGPPPVEPRRCTNPNCGAVLQPGNKFCSECGQPVTPRTPGVAAAQARHCTRCGRAAPAGRKFCQGCGAPLPAEVTK